MFAKPTGQLVTPESGVASSTMLNDLYHQEMGVQGYPIRNGVSGLVVKSIVAIDGPRVRFAADALLLLLLRVLSFLTFLDITDSS